MIRVLERAVDRLLRILPRGGGGHVRSRAARKAAEREAAVWGDQVRYEPTLPPLPELSEEGLYRPRLAAGRVVPNVWAPPAETSLDLPGWLLRMLLVPLAELAGEVERDRRRVPAITAGGAS